MENVKLLKEEITALKEKYNVSQKITLCAVTKYVGINEIKELVNSGVCDIAENRVQDFLDKQTVLKDLPIIWHFIGNLQTNKVKKVVNEIDFLHSLDRISLVKEINKHRREVLDCFVEVNCSGEENKQGLAENEVVSFMREIGKYPKIRVIGLMTIAKYTHDEKILKRTFEKLAGIRGIVQKLNLPYAPCTELSMGMSNDYPFAVEKGATFLRIGSKLFK